MVTNWAMSKDELYGPPPAYSVNPPPSIYTIPEIQFEYQERSSSHETIILSTRFLRYLLAVGLFYIVIGIIEIICDIILISMNETYSLSGLWAGISCIILGIYLIIFMSDATKEECTLYRFKLVHIILCLIIITALVLSSVNLASNSCSTVYFGLDSCQHSAQKFKIILITFFAFTLVQICITFIVTFVHIR